MSEEEKAGAGGAAEPAVKKYNLIGVPAAAERPKVSVEEMHKIVYMFSDRIFHNPAIAAKLKTAGLILRMEYYDPENWGETEPEVTILFDKDPIELYAGPCDIQPTVVLRMHSDIAHRFWTQKINMMVALVRRQMIARGPISQVTRLLPILKPSYPIYKEVLRDLGMNELLAYPAEKGAAEAEPGVDAPPES